MVIIIQPHKSETVLLQEAVNEFRGYLNDVCQLLISLQSKSDAEVKT